MSLSAEIASVKPQRNLIAESFCPEMQCRFIMSLTFEQQYVPHTFAAGECVPAGPASLQLPHALAALQEAHFAALGIALSALSSDSLTCTLCLKCRIEPSPGRFKSTRARCPHRVCCAKLIQTTLLVKANTRAHQDTETALLMNCLRPHLHMCLCCEACYTRARLLCSWVIVPI